MNGKGRFSYLGFVHFQYHFFPFFCDSFNILFLRLGRSTPHNQVQQNMYLLLENDHCVDIKNMGKQSLKATMAQMYLLRIFVLDVAQSPNGENSQHNTNNCC